jgi:hypothetical protein
VKNTPISAIGFGSSTAGMQTAVMNKKLNAAEPTIVDGPSAPAGLPSLPIVSRTESKISGAEEPKAIRERFAIVAFQIGYSMKNLFLPSLSQTSTRLTVDVIVSMASMKISAMMEIPKKRYSKKTK